MADRTCPKCNHIFKYPTMLKQHFKKSFHCLMDDEDIHIFFNPNIIKCNICSQTFVQKSSLYRHQRTIQCVNKKNSSKLSIPNTINIPQPTTAVTNNINHTNSHNTTNNNNTNNTIINNNNNINIQYINPFGFEDVRTIPITEMKKILNSGTEAGLHIIKAIYDKIENKNFYKPNLSRPEIACLN